MNSKNRKAFEPHRILFNLARKINLKRSNKYVGLSNLSMYYPWKNIKKSCNNNKFKISAPTWNERFDLPDGSHSVSDIQDYFKHTIKKHEKLPDNLPIRIFVNKIENMIKR